MAIHPIEVAKALEDTYRAYLQTTFAFRDTGLSQQLETALLQPGSIVKGPYLEATPPFTTARTLAELCEAGLLERGLLGINPEKLPPHRGLYAHQENAILKLVSGRNLVVATGTGSGKTECFLIPILNHLLKEKDEGNLDAGVRALLVYPMNALANDQLGRLRGLLAHMPDITFGRFTGDTEHDPQKARDRFAREHPGEEVLPNERLSRNEMVASPPHILITNFAMLEFMLLRPSESPFFDPPYNEGWRFLVLDEAHTYGGAKGAEIGMLIRRLKQRVVKGQSGVLQCIATSATLGRGINDAVEVANFASQLFGEQFDWKPAEEGRQDVVFGERIPTTAIPTSSIWKKAAMPYYAALSRWLETAESGVSDLPPGFLKEAGVPEEIYTAFYEMVSPTQAEAASVGAREHIPADTPEDNRVSRGLYYMLRHDPKVSELREILAGGPLEPLKAAARLWPHLPDERALVEVVNLVDLAIRAKPGKDELPLISARYHFFARALEGAFISFVPETVLTLQRDTQRGGAVFEVALCDECGQLYLAGHISIQGVLEQPRAVGEECDYFLVADSVLDPANDDEDQRVLVELPSGSVDSLFLCPWCGRLHSDNPSGCCQHNVSDEFIRLWRVKRSKSGLSRCGSCGTRTRDPIRRVMTGRDAPVAVLASTLYENIQVEPVRKRVAIQRQEPRSRYTGRISRKASTDKSGRKLLVFSDSRQQAAYFGWFLGETHADILWRRALLQVVREMEDRYGCVMVSDTIEPLTLMADRAGLLDDEGTPLDKRKQTWRYVMREFWAGPRVAGLESVGSLAFFPYWGSFELPVYDTPLQEYPWSLDPDQTYDFWSSLLDQFRVRGAIGFPDIVSPRDEFFSPRNREVYMRQKGAEIVKNGVILGWLPAQGQNGRSDLMVRILAKRGIEDRNAVEDALVGTWEMVEVLAESTNIMQRLAHQSAPVVYMLDPDGWRVTTRAMWGRCERCGTITSRPNLGVCPMYRCAGSIIPMEPEGALSSHHYRRLYNVDRILPMRVEEHTAQLNSQAASDLQKMFETGKVNVLSCSTTFEMGVDVGELEAVILHNVPPEPANYVQRAGRAGRRSSSTAFTLTYAQRRSHDATFYSDPPKMITGEIRPPSITLQNEKIVLRHLYAVALAWYFAKNSGKFQSLSGLEKIMPETAPFSVIADLHSELSRHPQDLLGAVESILPTEMQAKLGVQSWEWVDAFASPDPAHVSVLYTAIELLQADLAHIDEVRERRIQERKPIDSLDRLRRTLLDRDVISFLSSKSALPKYGFPVDVVALEILSHDHRARRLELERDLRLAIGEYAPGSEVVAGGYVWKSYALKKPPRRDWEQRRYVLCDMCHTYTELLKVEEEGTAVQCTGCGAEMGRERTYVIPSYGFVTKADQKLTRPKQTRPQRGYTSRVYFSHFDDPTPFTDGKSDYCDLPSGRLEWRTSSLGHLAVINTGPMDRGYRVCNTCGFAEPLLSAGARKNVHDRPFGGQCEHPYFFVAGLGHNFTTDVLELRFPLPFYDYGFWLSMTYALLEGAAAALSIARSDIDGCVYVAGGTPATPSIILFDDVPGGAGHVKRLAGDQALREVLSATLARVDSCECGEDTSCYGCLRNYRNQWCHHELKRGPVAQYMKAMIGVRAFSS